MLVSDFDFNLPDELIAHYPLPGRTSSRLLVVEGGSSNIRHDVFHNISRYLKPDDLLVLNNTRVIPARLFGCKTTGGKVEVLIERILDERTVLAHVRSSKAPVPGSSLLLEKHIEASVIERQKALFVLRFLSNETVISLLNSYGHIPLPPYISREDDISDRERYQTVYAKKSGAVAAPTAGLHFDEKLLSELEARGIKTVDVTLHVGAGTFQPVRAERIEDHHMHSEYMEVSESACRKIHDTRSRGGRIIAVGTTSVRCLETIGQQSNIQSYCGETDIFIYPGYRFKNVDLLITNFHLPRSTLLMLVSAFAGQTTISNAYREAIDKKYRFFSYGDAMLLSRQGLLL